MTDYVTHVYDILVTHAGASEGMRDSFVYHWGTPEYRFGGHLGFGGKFWYDRFRVDCYPEDVTPGRQVLMDEINRLLRELNG